MNFNVQQCNLLTKYKIKWQSRETPPMALMNQSALKKYSPEIAT